MIVLLLYLIAPSFSIVKIKKIENGGIFIFFKKEQTVKEPFILLYKEIRGLRFCKKNVTYVKLVKINAIEKLLKGVINVKIAQNVYNIVIDIIVTKLLKHK